MCLCKLADSDALGWLPRDADLTILSCKALDQCCQIEMQYDVCVYTVATLKKIKWTHTL